MNADEMKRLDCWLAENAMHWKEVHILKLKQAGEYALHSEEGVIVHEQQNRVRVWAPTRKGDDSMEVLKRCAERCEAEYGGVVSVGTDGKGYNVRCNVAYPLIGIIKAPTLELAFALFAQQLFTPNPKQEIEK